MSTVAHSITHGLLTDSSSIPFTQITTAVLAGGNAALPTDPSVYSPLPVDLIAFTAEPLGNKNALLQ